MKIFLTSAYKTHELLDAFNALAAQDRMGRHSLSKSPEDADAILFVENAQFDDYLYKDLRQNALLQRFPEKSFMYNEVDKPWCALPGLYCSMSRRFFQESRQVAFPYIQTPNQYIRFVHQWDTERKWLFSFVGSASHRCRREIMALAQTNRGVQDTSEFNVWDCTDNVRVAQGLNFAKTMAASQFMLCPRGIGTSSFRLFETMEAGRVPVIISNQWVPPPHVDWDFAVNVNERDIKSIPALLRSLENESVDRGKAARKAWQIAYASDVLFDTTVESVAYLLESMRFQQSQDRWVALRKLLIKTEVKSLYTFRRWRKSWLSA